MRAAFHRVLAIEIKYRHDSKENDTYERIAISPDAGATIIADRAVAAYQCLAEHLAQPPRQHDVNDDQLHRSIAEYAATMAGSEFDFDNELEAAAVEHLMNDEVERTA